MSGVAQCSCKEKFSFAFQQWKHLWQQHYLHLNSAESQVFVLATDKYQGLNGL